MTAKAGPGQRWLEQPKIATATATLVALVLTATVGVSYFDFYHRDVGYILHIGERLVDGARLYTDIIDENPPWVYWLGTLPVLLSRVLGVEPNAVFNGFAFLLSVVSAAWVYTLLRRGWPEVQPPLRATLSLLVAASLLLLPGNEFGQREDLLAATLMPYFFAAASWLRGRPIPPSLAVGVGLFASVALLFKPHFYFPCVFVELLLLVDGRGRKSWKRVEAWTIAVVAVVYALSVPLLVPAYFDVIRLALQYYGGYGQPNTFWVLATPGVGWALAAAALCWLFRSTPMNRELRRVLLCGIAGVILAGFLQSQGWYYHYDTAKLTAAVLIGLVILGPLVGTGGIRQVVRAPAAMIPIIALSVLLAVGSLRLAGAIEGRLAHSEAQPTTFEALKQIVTQHAGTEPILVLSTSIYPAFPLVNATEATWPSRYFALWLLPGLYSSEEKSQTPFPYRTREEMDEVEREFIDSYVDDMLAARPALLIVDRTATKQGFTGSSIDFLEYLLRDSRFADEFEHYARIQGAPGYRVYKRTRPVED